MPREIVLYSLCWRGVFSRIVSTVGWGVGSGVARRPIKVEWPPLTSPLGVFLFQVG